MIHHNKVIIALDFECGAELDCFLAKLPKQHYFFKIGMALFYKLGRDFVKQLKDQGHSVFLDLKLHDIPNTVQQATYNLSDLEIDLITVHISGGLAMLLAAKKGLAHLNVGKQPKIIGVTYLTSMTEKELTLLGYQPLSLQEHVLTASQIAVEAGLSGVVCSALEIADLHPYLPKDFLYVSPGIRLEPMFSDDQQRIVTPQQAKLSGASMIVVGRPITRSAKPYEVYSKIVNDFCLN